MADLFDGLILSCPNDGGMFMLHKGVSHKLDGFDTTGFDVRGDRIVRAIQPANLVLFHASARELSGKQINIDDLHDAFFDDDSCYVVSTRGNEIVKLDYNGEEQRRWTFPGEIDAWHINSITRWNGRLVFSAFTDRTSHRAYKEPPFETGFVQDLEIGERLITGLFQPHSLVPDGPRLLLANSGAFEVHEYDADSKLLRKRRLDGYTRGVARQGKVLYVGLSKSRNVETETMLGAAVVALDADTWEELGRIRLHVDEIYSVMPLADGIDAVGVLAKLASHASARSAGALAKAKRSLATVEQGRDQLAGQLDAVTRDRDERVRDSDRRIFGLLETVQGKDIQIQNRDQIIRERDDRLRDYERRFHGLLETLHGKDLQIQSRDQIILEKETEIRRRDQLIDSKGEEVQRNEALFVAKQTELDRLKDQLRASETQVGVLAGKLEDKDQQARFFLQSIRHKEEELRVLTEALVSSNETLRRLSDELDIAHARIETYAGELEAYRGGLRAMQATLSWRITRPLRGVRHLGSVLAHNRVFSALVHPVNKLRHASQTLSATLRDPERRMRYLTLARVLGPRAAMHHTMGYLRRGGPRPRPRIPVPVFDVCPGEGRKAVILTTPHCDFVAHSIRHALKKIGVESSIIHTRPEGGYESLPHFVICPQMFEQLPGLYVAFQMEQSVSTRWFTDAYMRMLENSFAILDYSVANIDALVDKGLHRKQIFYLPLGYLPDYDAAPVGGDEAYDVVFYGDINNDRRRRFVAALEKICHVRVFNDLFGEPLHAELAKAKLVVNIHYYEGALLETTRLWECVSLGKLVVSERAVNMDENRDLERLVDFVDLNDVEGMVERVRYWLTNESARQARLKANRGVAERQANRFEYFFYRFLLAWDIISFHRFWELAGSKLTLGSDKLCLNLPEWTQRRRSFDQDNHYGFEVFPGLRHREGWIGCGLSYKLMIMLARKQRLKRVTICEDDVEFRTGFEAGFKAVLTETSEPHNRWDVFSGFLGDLHASAEVSSVSELCGRKFVHIDKLISMVFNIYNRTIYDRVSLWDERDRDVVKNTIDRYLERTHLDVLCCHPFLVGHKDELHSTLWGIQNGNMSIMIQRSEQLLCRKIRDFEEELSRPHSTKLHK